MTLIPTAPQFRVDGVRTHLHRDRAYAEASSTAERFADALLDGITDAVRLGARRKPVTLSELASIVEAAEKTALAADTALCGCGHGWSEHVGRGCTLCDPCRVRRPEREVSWTPTVLPTAAELAAAYADEERGFPHGGAR